jgi:hypothetical protein
MAQRWQVAQAKLLLDQLTGLAPWHRIIFLDICTFFILTHQLVAAPILLSITKLPLQLDQIFKDPTTTIEFSALDRINTGLMVADFCTIGPDILLAQEIIFPNNLPCSNNAQCLTLDNILDHPTVLAKLRML